MADGAGRCDEQRGRSEKLVAMSISPTAATGIPGRPTAHGLPDLPTACAGAFGHVR